MVWCRLISVWQMTISPAVTFNAFLRLNHLISTQKFEPNSYRPIDYTVSYFVKPLNMAFVLPKQLIYDYTDKICATLYASAGS